MWLDVGNDEPDSLGVGGGEHRAVGVKDAATPQGEPPLLLPATSAWTIDTVLSTARATANVSPLVRNLFFKVLSRRRWPLLVGTKISSAPLFASIRAGSAYQMSSQMRIPNTVSRNGMTGSSVEQ